MKHVFDFFGRRMEKRLESGGDDENV